MFRQINRAIPHDVQGVEENKKQLQSQCSSKEKKDTKSNKMFLGDKITFPTNALIIKT
jgi:hypothetical protein